MSNHKDFGIGAGLIAFLGMIPETMLDLGSKAILAVIGAFVTGFVYRAGGALFDKLKDNKNVGKSEKSGVSGPGGGECGPGSG